MRLFVYATLKSKMTQKRAMGHAAVSEARAYLFGFRERSLAYDGDDWPTLVAAQGPMAVVEGEILDVSSADLQKLDKWENRYSRIEVTTRPTGETAWTYVLNLVKTRRTANG